MNIDIETILKLDLETTYKLHKILELEHPELKKNSDMIRNGINLEFDIYDILTKRFTEKPKQGLILIRGKECKLREFHTEMEQREALLKKGIIQATQEEETVEGR